MNERHNTLSRILLAGGIALIVAIAFWSVSQQSAIAGTDCHGFLGVYLTSKVEVTIEDGEKSEKTGKAYVDVVEDGPADKAGLEDGDLIVSFNGKGVDNTKELQKLIHKTKPGDKVKVVVQRGGKELQFSVEMGEPPAKKIFSWMGKGKSGKHRMKLKYKGCVSDDRGWMGVELQDLSDQLGEYFKVDDGKGALVSSVMEDSPAEKAGLAAGDVIFKLDDEPIEDSGDLVTSLLDNEPGDKVAVKLIRKGKKKTIKVELSEVPEKYACGSCDKDSQSLFLDCGDFDFGDFDCFDDLKIMKFKHHLDLDDFDDLKDIQINLEGPMEELKEELQRLKEEIDKLKEEHEKN
ncbi:hypothetical protein CEE37_04380 [candidate division LCP-89 bacterium B3_LCP]|uniref:PDZ domain-containing protein n=1 Tax=candidate division LCP-89 bacterium B3_LCP TaxID=2012998 RepID=A0A532V3L8_UNCL8|nr:MAG: hypothetical protein CEE37_04380 [candidate division LCP-89 bacterium B3_LCP]